jgi:flagellar motor component MotA
MIVISVVAFGILTVTISAISNTIEDGNIKFFMLLAAFIFISAALLLSLYIWKYYEKEKAHLEKMKEHMMRNNDEKLKYYITSFDTPQHKMSHDEQVDNTIKEAFIKQKAQRDILELMFDNTGEIRAYFSISKNHARLSFWLAILTCIFGVVLLGLAVHYALTNPKIEPSVIAAIGGAISEVFAATSLVVHKKSLKQLNHYYDALHDNEMFLSTVHLVGNLSIDKQDDIYMEIIKRELDIRYVKATGKSKEYKAGAEPVPDAAYNNNTGQG